MLHINPSIMSPTASAYLGTRIAAELGVLFSAPEEREFEGGDHKIRPRDPVRGRAMYVVQSLKGDTQGSTNDKLCRLLFLIGALKDAGASTVTACLPYLAYARKDRRTQPNDPITSRYVAQLFEAVGTDRVIALEPHKPAAFDNAFRCEAICLDASELFATACSPFGQDLVVVSPDVGGIKRAQRFAEVLGDKLSRPLEMAFMEKKRTRGELTGNHLVGPVRGRATLIIDDLISSGNTALRAAHACREAGAERVYVLATHAIFTPEARRLFSDDAIDSVLVTNSVTLAPEYEEFSHKLTILDIAALFAKIIQELESAKDV